MPFEPKLYRIKPKMDSLKTLKGQFEKGTKQYPGLTYVWLECSKTTLSWDIPDEIKEEIAEYQNNYPCFIWYGLVNLEKPGQTQKVDTAVQFWIMKPQSKPWDMSEAGRNFYHLAMCAGQCVSGRRFLGHIIMPALRCMEYVGAKSDDGHPIARLLPYDSAVVRWLFAIHELRPPTIRKELGEKDFMVAWTDVFMESASVCNMLQEYSAETEQGDKVSKITIMARTSEENWEAIRSEYDISRKDFGKKINFVSDSFKRKIIFRDVEHAFVLASQGYSKPALILAGGVIEELLRLYLEHKKIKPKDKKFFAYIKACEDNDLLKRGVSRLSDSIRDFRNLVHLNNEETKSHTVSKATAKGAVSSIFTIANDFR